MAIYDSQTQSKSTRNSRNYRDIDLDFARNPVNNDVNVVAVSYTHLRAH